MNFFKTPFPVWELGLWGSRKGKGLDSAKGVKGGWFRVVPPGSGKWGSHSHDACLLYTSDAADERK